MKRLLIDTFMAAVAFTIVGSTACLVLALGIWMVQTINPTLGACP